MRRHQRYYLKRMPGDEPASSNNICLLYTAAKMMTFTTLLHIHIRNFESDPHQITEHLRNHLLAVKVDDDANMMEFLLTSIISTLRASCDIMDSLNHLGYVAENEEKCKAHLDSSKNCVDVIRSIAIWLSFILDRARFVVDIVAKVAPSDGELARLAKAIKKLGGSKFFLLVMQSLTKALTTIVETAVRNTFSKALSNEGCLERSFRSCLVAIRNSIALVHACRDGAAPEMQSTQLKNDWESAAEVYLSFVVSNCESFTC